MWRWVEGCCSGERGEVVSCNGGEAKAFDFGGGGAVPWWWRRGGVCLVLGDRGKGGVDRGVERVRGCCKGVASVDGILGALKGRQKLAQDPEGVEMGVQVPSDSGGALMRSEESIASHTPLITS
jgi:hypothetical protein